MRFLMTAVAAWAALGAARPVEACPPTPRTDVCVTIADGSDPSGGIVDVYGISDQGAGHSVGGPAQPGTTCFEFLLTGVGEWRFRASVQGYFQSTWVGGVTCNAQNGCLQCFGSVPAMSVYSFQGTIKGSVTKIPSGGAATGTVTAINTRGWGRTIGIVDGRYDFDTSPVNNWGLLVYDGGPGPGIAEYTVRAGGSLPASATIVSNEEKLVDLTVLEPGTDPQPRCNDPEETQPGPSLASLAGPAPAAPSCPACQVGAPIDLATGNMYFDQSDTAIPGVGTGLVLTRSYNSANLTTGTFSEAFGPGWSHSYAKRLFIPAGMTDIVAVRKGNGVAAYYQDTDHDNKFLQSYPWSAASWIDKQGSTYTRRFKGGGSESYDSQGRLTSLIDRNNNTTSLTYDASSRLTTIAEPSGRILTLHYLGSAVQPDSLIGPGGITLASYGYNSGKLTSVTYPDSPDDADPSDPDGGYTFEYGGPGGRLSTVRDLTGRIVEHHEYITASGPYYGYARTSELSAGPEPDGVERYSVEYQGSKTIVRSRRVAGAPEDETTYEFASTWGQWKVAKVTGPCASCGGGGASRQWTYDSKGRVTTYTDAGGAVTTYTYNSATGDLLSEVRTGKGGLSHTTGYTYDSLGRMLTRTDPNGHLTTWTYATVAGPDTIKDKATAADRFRVTSFTYQPDGKLWTVTDPRGKQTTLTYYATGDLQIVTDPSTNQTGFEYDLLGRRTRVTDALGNPTETAYNSRGQVVRLRQFKDGSPIDTLFAYDKAGRRVWVKDPNLNQTDYTYDTYGRLQHVDQPQLDNGERPRTTYGYDLMSNLTSLTDANDHTTVFDYDGYNRVKTVTYPGNRLESFTYDTAGHLETKTDRKGVVTTHGYDDFGRLTSKTYSDGTTPAAHYFHDENGDLGFVTRADLGGQRKLGWDYDLAGQLKQEHYWHDGTALTSTVAYTYDPAGNRSTLSLDGQVFSSYAYDNTGRLSSISRGSSSFGFGYDDANRRLSMNYPNGVITSYAYDDLSRLLSIDAVKGAAAITHAGYTYDDAGNRMSKTQLDYAETYEYDALHRLTHAIRGGLTTEQYGYDRVGNRLTSIDHNDWDYNERNELESHDAATFQYDLNGNLTQKVDGSHTWVYEWNAENQLARVVRDGSEAARFIYDPAGRRVQKVLPTGATTYTYSLEDILREDRAGLVLSYVHGPGIDEPLSTEGAGTTRYLHSDGLGSELKRTDPSGSVVFSRGYDAFGQLQIGATSAGYAFAGREWDPELGLFYYRARYYDASLGRFISEDPLPGRKPGQRGGTVTPALGPLGYRVGLGTLHLLDGAAGVDQLHKYSYVGNSPASYFDPSGRSGLMHWVHGLDILKLLVCAKKHLDCTAAVAKQCECVTDFRSVCLTNGNSCCDSVLLHCASFGLLGSTGPCS